MGLRVLCIVCVPCWRTSDTLKLELGSCEAPALGLGTVIVGPLEEQ